jgi:hypothetical protein
MTREVSERLKKKYSPGKTASREALFEHFTEYLEDAKRMYEILSSAKDLSPAKNPSGSKRVSFLEGSRKSGEAAVAAAGIILEVMMNTGIIDDAKYSQLRQEETTPLSLAFIEYELNNKDFPGPP